MRQINMNDQRALNKLIDFIQDTHWTNMSPDVQKQSIKCFLDLASVLCCGAKNRSAKLAAKYVSDNYPVGKNTIMSTKGKNYVTYSFYKLMCEKIHFP